MVGQSDHGQGITGQRMTIGFGHFAHHQSVSHVVQHIHVREQRVILKNGVHIPRIGRGAGGFLPKQRQTAATGLLKARHQPQGGGLARARRPQHREKLAFFHLEAYAVQRLDLSVMP